MSEFYRHVWVRYKGKPYYARVIRGMYGNYYELTYDTCGRHFSQTIRQEDAVKLEPPTFEKVKWFTILATNVLLLMSWLRFLIIMVIISICIVS